MSDVKIEGYELKPGFKGMAQILALIKQCLKVFSGGKS